MTMMETNGAAMASPTTDAAGRSIAAFASENNFIAAQRMAKALSSSSLVPAAYQGNIPNVLIAMEMAARIGMSVFMVMQSLDVIHGRPSWSSKFLIATVNASRRFTPLRFKWEGTVGADDWGCRAVAKDREDGEPCVGPLVTIAMAKAEGWYAKNGSKWKTLPELMLMYRSGGFWTRVYCPEISLGLGTTEEVIDTTGYSISEVVTPRGVLPGSPQELEAALLGVPAAKSSEPGAAARETVDEHGEVTGETVAVVASAEPVAATGQASLLGIAAPTSDDSRKKAKRAQGEPGENGAAS